VTAKKTENFLLPGLAKVHSALAAASIDDNQLGHLSNHGFGILTEFQRPAE